MSLLIERMHEAFELRYVASPAQLRAALRKAVVFEISNVANYLFKHSGYRQWIDYEQVFPNLAPPFESFWMEYENPTAVLAHDGVLKEPSRIPGFTFRHGSLFTLRPGNRWSIGATYFFGSPKHRMATRQLDYQLDLNADGSVVTPPARPDKAIPLPQIQIPREARPRFQSAEDEEASMLADWFYQLPMLLAISFLHCKRDVSIKLHEPPPALAKANLKRGKQVVRFNTIEIESITEILKREGRIEENGLGKALHICRGHFARYAEDGPGLFGKGIHGTFWVPQHLRGKVDLGVVASNYKVNAPRRPE